MGTQESYVFFWFVTFCGMFTAFVPFVVRMVLQVISQETEMESNMRRQVCDLRAELGSMNIVDEFAKYAKIQRKINKMSEELAHQAKLKSMYTFKVRLAATALLYALVGVAVAYLVWNYRSQPVVVLPEAWFSPIGSLLAPASGPPGGIGLTPWLLVSSSVGRQIAKHL
ncbi:guided entry of tail-anchored proteins factor 1 [Rhipicephalus microplus]|uniref:Guided entry of tail-anchored proteins factor 1 n=1 Tax=Rhipicephalus microplus TaxID=6941 RepID=A0A6M2CKE6_RHIMP